MQIQKNIYCVNLDEREFIEKAYNHISDAFNIPFNKMPAIIKSEINGLESLIDVFNLAKPGLGEYLKKEYKYIYELNKMANKDIEKLKKDDYASEKDYNKICEVIRNMYESMKEKIINDFDTFELFKHEKTQGFFNKEKNFIFIPNHNTSLEETLGEELGHFLRNHFCKKKEVGEDEEEFFGYLGRYFLKKLLPEYSEKIDTGNDKNFKILKEELEKCDNAASFINRNTKEIKNFKKKIDNVDMYLSYDNKIKECFLKIYDNDEWEFVSELETLVYAKNNRFAANMRWVKKLINDLTEGFDDPIKYNENSREVSVGPDDYSNENKSKYFRDMIKSYRDYLRETITKRNEEIIKKKYEKSYHEHIRGYFYAEKIILGGYPVLEVAKNYPKHFFKSFRDFIELYIRLNLECKDLVKNFKELEVELKI